MNRDLDCGELRDLVARIASDPRSGRVSSATARRSVTSSSCGATITSTSG